MGNIQGNGKGKEKESVDLPIIDEDFNPYIEVFIRTAIGKIHDSKYHLSWEINLPKLIIPEGMTEEKMKEDILKLMSGNVNYFADERLESEKKYHKFLAYKIKRNDPMRKIDKALKQTYYYPCVKHDDEDYVECHCRENKILDGCLEEIKDSYRFSFIQKVLYTVLLEKLSARWGFTTSSDPDSVIENGEFPYSGVMYKSSIPLPPIPISNSILHI